MHFQRPHAAVVKKFGGVRRPFASHPSHPGTHQPVTDDLFRLVHDAIDEFLAGGDVVDEARDHAAAPGAGIHLPVQHDLGIDARNLVVDVVDGQLVALGMLDLEQAIDIGVLQHALGGRDAAGPLPFEALLTALSRRKAHTSR